MYRGTIATAARKMTRAITIRSSNGIGFNFTAEDEDEEEEEKEEEEEEEEKEGEGEGREKWKRRRRNSRLEDGRGWTGENMEIERDGGFLP